MSAPPPVDRAVAVRLSPAEAFDLFTRELRLWWPFAAHSISGAEALDVEFERRAGGAVSELSRAGERHLWGTLTEWDPPRAFAMRWHPGLPIAEATRLRVSFTASDEGTEVRVRHDGWEARGAAAQQRRDQYDGGWPGVLAAFAARAAGRGR